jgi:hypothetical protein
MVRLQTLDLRIGVRVPASQPNRNRMRIRHLILFVVMLPAAALGQQTPAAEADRAVRARVTEFLQYHVDANFRKAYDMVAEDTKDDYFASGKVQIKGFKIEDVKFADNFTKATVTGTISKTFNVAGTDVPVTVPSTTTWKIENNKWVWYNDTKSAPATPMGLASASPAGAAPPRGADNGGDALPKNFDDKTISAAAQSILQQVGVDKKEVTLAADRASEEKVIFHNGMTGSVQLELTVPEIPGFSARLEQTVVRAAGDVPVVFRYAPGDPATRRDPISVQLTVQPLNQVFVIRVNFAAPAPLR